MAAFGPGINGNQGKLIQCVADNIGPPLVEGGFSGLDIPLPCAHVGALEDIVKPLLLRGHCLQELFVIGLRLFQLPDSLFQFFIGRFLRHDWYLNFIKRSSCDDLHYV